MTTKIPKKPKAVLISDIHFTLNTLFLALASLQAAQQKALQLGVPLVLAGDTLDGKAILRAECVNSLINILKTSKVETIVLVGNHDLINEKGKSHSLDFLRPYCKVVDSPTLAHDMYFLPYYSDQQYLRAILDGISKDKIVVMHQGVQTAYMGHYVRDTSSMLPEVFHDRTVFSGHYHRHQTIKCGRSGSFTYIGNPYTLGFGEASDGPKGFLVLYDDGSFDHIPTRLRKHIVSEQVLGKLTFVDHTYGDLLWVKLQGPRDELNNFDRDGVGSLLWGESFKLDKIYTDTTVAKIVLPPHTEEQAFDRLVDLGTETEERKSEIKLLWRNTLNATNIV